MPPTSHFTTQNVNANATKYNNNLLHIKACDEANISKSDPRLQFASASIIFLLKKFSGGMLKTEHAPALGQALLIQRQRPVVIARVACISELPVMSVNALVMNAKTQINAALRLSQHFISSKIIAVISQALHSLNELHARLHLPCNHVENAFNLLGNALCCFFCGGAARICGGARFGAVDGNGCAQHQTTVHDTGDTFSRVRRWDESAE
jgi:hypothetical protein